MGRRGRRPYRLVKYTATLLDEAGESARAIASYLGHHNPNITQKDYMDLRRKAATAGLSLGSFELEGAVDVQGNAEKPPSRTLIRSRKGALLSQ